MINIIFNDSFFILCLTYSKLLLMGYNKYITYHLRDSDKMDIIKKCKDILMEYEDIIFAYIFGSYVSGKIRVDSDIDIAIYLEKNIDIYTYIEIKMNLSEVLKREVDLVILNNAPPLLKYEIYKNNILIFSRDKTLESKYKVKTLFEYNDVKRYLNLSYDKTIERLKKEV